jgi:surface protein
MFYNASSLTSLDLSSFNTSSVTNMISMFRGASSLTSLDLTSWNTNHQLSYDGWITDMNGTIYCNDPDGGGTGSPATGTVNGVACY